MNVNPKMITLAREAAGLTQSQMAAETNVSQALISKVENGFEEPSEQLLRRIANRCDVPPDFFTQTDEILGEGLVDYFHKKRLTLPAKPLKQANATVNTVRLEALRLLRLVELTDVAPFPSFDIEDHGSVEEIAQMVRAAWRVPAGPLPNLIALVEAAAVPVFLVDLGHEKLFAISMPGLAGRHVITLNSALPPSARRFALAHELGHLVMHHGVATADMERDADRFASALLMPAADIRPALRNIRFRDLGALKSVWKVSLAALIRRAHDLGEISDRHYRTLNIQLSKLPGGRKHEPGEFEPETPRLIRHVVEHYQRDLDYTTEDLARLLVVNEAQLRQRYLGEDHRTLRAVGSDQALHRVPMP